MQDIRFRIQEKKMFFLTESYFLNLFYMDYTDAALSYALLLIPLGFSGVLVAQGVSKIKKKEESGKVILGMGVLFLLLIPAAYFLLTRV